MSGSRKCLTCGLHYIGWWENTCWFCLNGYDPRGPFAGSPSEERKA